ncbi:MAG: BTAD domain-containing putative transcriptional regulator [Chloroflexota bacterium]
MKTNTQLTIRLLGVPKLLRHNQPLTALTRAKSNALLYYLIAVGRPVTRDELTALLWPDSSPDAARRNLRNHLAILRKHLSPYLSSTTGEVAFQYTADCDSDIHQFEALQIDGNGTQVSRATDLADVRRVLALYRGDFLSGFMVPNADLFNDWVGTKRAELAMRYSHALYQLIKVEASQGNQPQALSDLDKLLTTVPWHEEGHRLKMRLLAEQGKRWAALEQYETLRDILDKELDVSPDEETEALAAHIRDGQITPTSSSDTVTSTVLSSTTDRPVKDAIFPQYVSPAPLTELLGHDILLTKAVDYLKNSAHRLVTLMGMGGVGKSHMALTLGQRMGDAFAHGVCFVPLAGIVVDERDTEEQVIHSVIAEVASALQLPLGSADAVMAQVTSYLRRRELLLILDNFEHVLAARSVVTTLLQSAPKCTVLVTSRVRLQLPSETVLRVKPLSTPMLDDVQHTLDSAQSISDDVVTTRYAVIQLFLDRVRRYNPEFELHREHFGDIIQICQQTGGLPLALEMVAGWTEHLTLPQIADQLQKNAQPLLQGATSELSSYTSVDDLFERSWQLLNEVSRRSLLYISHFTAGFDSTAAGVIANVNLADLRQLTDTSFLQSQTSGRYTLHPLVQQFVQKKWTMHYGEHSREIDHFWQAYCAYYMMFMHERVAKMNTAEGPQVMAEMRQEQDHIAMAWQQALQRQQLSLVQQMVEAFAQFYMRNGSYEQVLRILRHLNNTIQTGQLIAQTDHRYTSMRFQIGILQSETYMYLGQWDKVLNQATTIQSLLAEPVAPRQQVHHYLQMATVYMNTGVMDDCKTSLDRAGQLLSDEMPCEVQRNYHFLVARCWYMEGDFDTCAHHLELSITHCRQAEDRWHEAILLRMRALFLHPLLTQEQTLSYLDKALALNQETQNRIEEAQVLNAYMTLTHYRYQERRIRQLQKAIAVYDDLGEDCYIYVSINHLCREYLCLGRYAEVRQLYSTLSANIDKQPEVGTTYWVWVLASLLARIEGDTAQAVAHGKTAVAMHPNIRQRDCTAGFLSLGHAHLEQGAYGEAQQAFQAALDHIRIHPRTMSETYARAGLADVAYRQGDYATALVEVESLLPMLDEEEQHRNTIEHFHPHWTCYQVLGSVDESRAKDVLEQSYAQLMERADSLDNEEWRRSLLENVRVNRSIAEAMQVA